MKTVQQSHFNVAQLLKAPIGSTRQYDVVLPVDEEVAGLKLVEPITGRVHMLRTNRGVLVEGRLDAAVQVECGRCLADVVIPLTMHIEEEFQPTVDVVRGTYLLVEEDDTSLLINEQHILDMSEVLRQALLLEVPMQVLCRPDCAGICPTCGQDLNTGACDCAQADLDPRWEALNALLADVDV
jgi:uncharacterized protein